MKQICQSEFGLDAKVMIAAAYAHDWGYIDLFPNGVTDFDDVHRKKADHMRIGADKIKDLLTSDLGDVYTVEQIERVVYLVSVHDRLDLFDDNTSDDVIALVEADTLGALDADRVKPTFSRENNEEYIEKEVWGKRRPLFRHRLAIEVFDSLLASRQAFYDNL